MEPFITEIKPVGTGELVLRVREALTAALANRGEVESLVLDMDGMSGRKYRLFINSLIRSLPNPRYLEIGSLTGSTLCSAVSGNEVRATAIDNWSQFGGPRETFYANLEAYRPPSAVVRVIEDDFRGVDYRSTGTFDVFLYDGPHGPEDQFDGISLALPVLNQAFVLIVADWH